MNFPLYPILKKKSVGMPTEGLMAYYPFNGNANDDSGNGHNGTVYGATLTTDRKGNPNKAYSFDGSDYIDTSNFSNITSNFSISLWINWVAGNNMGILQKGTGTGGDFHLILYNKEVYFRINGLNKEVISTTGNMDNGMWRHIVAIFTETQLKLIIDNSNINISSAAVSLNNNYTSITFGRYYSPSFYLTGLLDDIRIYNRVLTDQEITALYNE
jgi:hypothetical protein